jgi:hypothetical protein
VSIETMRILEFYEKKLIIQMKKENSLYFSGVFLGLAFSFSNLMPKIIIETGRKNDILRTVSTPLHQNELAHHADLIQAMLKHIKNPANG